MALWKSPLLRRNWLAFLALIFLIGWYLHLQRATATLRTPKSERIRIPTPSASSHPHTPPPPPPPPPEFAYVFYATKDTYACSAMINAHILRSSLKTTYPIILIAGPNVTSTTLEAFHNSKANITVVSDVAPPTRDGSSQYYAEVLLKLKALRLHKVFPTLKRVVILDSDQLVRKSLDNLFLLPEVDLAAPLSYWSPGVAVTTTLMVASLSDELWGIVDEALQHIKLDEYDMDLVNRVLMKRLMILPGRYCTLNSHWEAQDTPGWFKGIKTEANASHREMVALYRAVEVLHFTALGKPWDVDPSQIKENRKRIGLAEPHPIFIQQFEEWWAHADRLCPFVDLGILKPTPTPRTTAAPSPSQTPSTSTSRALVA